MGGGGGLVCTVLHRKLCDWDLGCVSQGSATSVVLTEHAHVEAAVSRIEGHFRLQFPKPYK